MSVDWFRNAAGGVHGVFAEIRRLLIGGGSEDEAVNVFDAPAVTHKFAGKIIEEFRIGGRFAASAEITGRSDDAGSEVVRPYTVHHDAGGQRVIWIGEDFDQELRRPVESRFFGRMIFAGAGLMTVRKAGCTSVFGLS